MGSSLTVGSMLPVGDSDKASDGTPDGTAVTGFGVGSPVGVAIGDREGKSVSVAEPSVCHVGDDEGTSVSIPRASAIQEGELEGTPVSIPLPRLVHVGASLATPEGGEDG